MGVLSDIFMATPEEADQVDLKWGPIGPPAALPRSRVPWRRKAPVVSSTAPPEPLFPMVAAKSVDPVKLATLEGILTGMTFDEILPDLNGGYERVAGEEGPWLLGVRPSLVTAMAQLRPGDTPETAAKWAATEEWRGAAGAELEGLLLDLGRLAAKATNEGRRLYLWVSL